MTSEPVKICQNCGAEMIRFKQLTHGNRRNSWYCPRCQQERVDAMRPTEDSPGRAKSVAGSTPARWPRLGK